MTLLAGKRVLITGGSTGIGAAAAVEAHAKGQTLRSTMPAARRAQQVIAQIEALGRKGLAVQGDVADPATARILSPRRSRPLAALMSLSRTRGSALPRPARHAGRGGGPHVPGEPAWRLLHGAGRRPADGETGNGGAIIAVSSISALVGGEFQTHYTPTKAGVHSLMQSAAIALGKHGIRCNSVMPGTILTEINKDDLADTAKRERMSARIPLGRLGEADDLAGPIVFFASDMARYAPARRCWSMAALCEPAIGPAR
jgi:L-rhamnose 1-dehydrogenase